MIVQGLNFYLLLSVVFPTDNCLPLDLVIHLLTRPWNAILATRNTAAVACVQSLFNQVLRRAHFFETDLEIWAGLSFLGSLQLMIFLFYHISSCSFYP